MNLSETLYPAEAAEDTVEALFHEQGRDRPVLFWLTALVLGAAIASLPLVKVDLSVGARGIVRLLERGSGRVARSCGGPALRFP